ncbi:class I SAM-dependent methyltransferase [Candidatus Woesearchaeota archaeon]|nr:class I SAM-dependent methyltransferase [Candidatus Woesearchaeota archaeon]
MKQQMLYHELAKYYDLIYSKKKYKKESEILKRIISTYKKSKGRELLDVACGTGQHLKYLKKHFSCTGIDINKEILDIARKKVKGVTYKQADMTAFKLKKKFDVVLCLFSSIGYAKTYSNLKKTINNFSNHLKKGGVVIIEPWLQKDAFKKGTPWAELYEEENLKVTRVSTTKIKEKISVIEMHYLIAEKGKDIKHFTDYHKLGLFKINKTLEFMKDAGLKSKYLKRGLKKQRGLYIGVKE